MKKHLGVDPKSKRPVDEYRYPISRLLLRLDGRHNTWIRAIFVLCGLIHSLKAALQLAKIP
jgi:hypothetical protein